MTAVLDNLTTTMEHLIESCQRSQRGFKAAAEAAQSDDLKRLLNIYSHQRTRFAGELKSQCRDESPFSPVVEDRADPYAGKSDEEILQSCVEEDASCLDAYAQALGSRLAGKAHFVIAAQYSLMQQVHQRMRALTAKTSKARVTTVSHCYET